MSLTRLQCQQFSAFEDLDVELSPGINVFIGENGTGKTHILQAAYAACDISRSKGSFGLKLTRVFRPYEDRIGRLAYRTAKSNTARLTVTRPVGSLSVSFTNHTKDPLSAKVRGKSAWTSSPLESVYIPVREVLANAPGFRALYANRDIAFSEVYPDLIDRALRPVLRGPHTADRKRLLKAIRSAMEGRVTVDEEQFFHESRRGKLEFSLVSEGMRKLGLIWLLVQNGTLLDGAVLCWDEPEANLNPRKLGNLIDILLDLQRLGVQVLLATHDYVLLKELSLRATPDDQLRFHSLYRDAEGRVRHEAADEAAALSANAIADTFADLYDRDLRRALDAS